MGSIPHAPLSKMDKVEMAVEMYDYFYSKYKQGGMGMPRTKANDTIVKKFIQRVEQDNTIGVNWLFYYCAYQFYRMMRGNYKKVFTNYIYGEKPYAYWKEKKGGWDVFMQRDFLASRGIIQAKAIQVVMDNLSDGKVVEVEDYSAADELMKNVHNRDLMACTSFTSMWNPSSTYCKTCPNKKRCKDVLKKTDHELYKKRLDESYKSILAGTPKGKYY